MRDVTLEDTVRHGFTTRAFATGIPTVLAGTPVLSVLEENNATPITAGVSVSVDRASVAGLNEATVLAKAANGYEVGKNYSIYISTGTVGGVSVVGEVVGQFQVQASAAAVDLANATDGLGAIKAETAVILADVTGLNGDPMRGTDSAALASVATEARLAELDAANLPADVDAILVDTTGLNGDAMRGTDGVDTATMRGTDSAALASINTEARLAELDAANIPTDLADIQGATFNTATDSLEAIRDRGDAAWTTGAGGTPPDLLQSTTIATLATQVSFTLTAGSADNDAYNAMLAIITDAVTAEQKAVSIISNYVGATKTVTLREDPAVFTMAVGDTIDIVAISRDTLDILADVTGLNGDAMRGTDGVDTATMRGTDGVDTATMRGTDGANTTTPPTATVIADTTLRRTYANARTSGDGDAVNGRSLLGAIGKLVNKVNVVGSTLTVFQEDDVTATAPGFTQTVVTDAAADPITSVDTT